MERGERGPRKGRRRKSRANPFGKGRWCSDFLGSGWRPEGDQPGRKEAEGRARLGPSETELKGGDLLVVGGDALLGVVKGGSGRQGADTPPMGVLNT